MHRINALPATQGRCVLCCLTLLSGGQRRHSTAHPTRCSPGRLGRPMLPLLSSCWPKVIEPRLPITHMGWRPPRRQFCCGEPADAPRRRPGAFACPCLLLQGPHPFPCPICRLCSRLVHPLRLHGAVVGGVLRPSGRTALHRCAAAGGSQRECSKPGAGHTMRDCCDAG